MDEPSMGLAPLMMREIARTIQTLNTVAGTGRELADKPDVKRAYLGA
jgi:ABC-type transporter Mla maintaining outer membrane lipid asymmetry ATPase subunit MlaF